MVADLVIVKIVYLTTVCILHDKAQAVMCLEWVFQSLQTEKTILKAELGDVSS